MDTNEIIATLNELIETSRDGEAGFRTCADGVKNARLKQMFEQAADRCRQAVGELQAKVRSLGGDPERRGSVSGALHRGWVDIKSTITGMDEAAVLAECERGEDVAKRTYEQALAKDLPADVRTIVERQYQGVRQHHDRVRQARNAVF
ncbi:MAG: PA2169 family four-helix-bundle protein [Alphaproteobacteria bacterium]|nr:PA2169 family four-helix-bundle protein [Alphaproteobacteria bacterium]